MRELPCSGPQQRFYALWDRGNPLSPLNLYKDGSSVRAQVGAITFFKRGNGGEDLAQIRLPRPGAWVVVGGEADVALDRHGSVTSMVSVQRPENPALESVGIQIVDYRSESE